MESPIDAFFIFEELSVEFVGPLPKDEMGNSYIFNAYTAPHGTANCLRWRQKLLLWKRIACWRLSLAAVAFDGCDPIGSRTL